jgi:3-phosphoshikimate 1-carboxyvinyltransferase
MGANITLFNETLFGLEPVADIRIQYAPLHGIDIPPDLISKAIDEFPAIFIAAVTATGKTILHNAKELRVKESDRIKAMVNGLRALGVQIEEYDDGVSIEGNQVFQGGHVDSCGDHRVAMAFSVAGNIAKAPVFVDNCDFVKTSFPNFVELAHQVGMKLCLQSQS